ncbi:MAG: hypothetical protein M0P70_19535 [Desulfobulbaceae bacterium]|nr:hypothetical protein [Desulfobulbaceae bacterium]
MGFYLFTGSRRAEAQKKSSARNREAQTFLCKIIGVACPGLSSFSWGLPGEDPGLRETQPLNLKHLLRRLPSPSLTSGAALVIEILPSRQP